ncbi:Molybdopterin-guanine dinucleotide biosynthesis protein MobA [hydrothermal vent metagenome]|uniref:Molybdopterin-guanine dinucleotide biosynthesis protein MobA n=1 Tax=hydrothermal vent metagenome TaxID=652676 RepID=A0A3B1DHZ8_9ZZZZ
MGECIALLFGGRDDRPTVRTITIFTTRKDFMSSDGLQLIQPAVLAGGRSRRFGRDKLVEPLHDALLIDHPIRTLREVFGPRVGIVGECAPRVASRADMVIPDPYPGIGPIGGLLAALEYARGPVFLLAGDLAAITPETIRRILAAAAAPGEEEAGEAESVEPLAIIAATDRPQPCIGLYRPQAAAYLRRALSDERFALRHAIPAAHVRLVEVAAEAARNINRPDDLVNRKNR